MTAQIIVFFFLSALCMAGCDPSYNYHSAKITVIKIYEDEKDYSLLSVRGDSAIVVLDWKERDVKPILFSHAKIIRDDSVAWISREGKGAQTPTVTGTLIGTGIGLILAILTGSTSLGSVRVRTEFGFAVIGIGALSGAGISTLSPPDEKISPASEKGREFLRSISLYPDKEPPEMQYIK